jgi:arylsulfatase A-like enzyme
MNILFIMCDQLRADYLSCYGHPHLKTPNIDVLAAHGVRFNRAYCQAPLCGPSRASFYTGRYMSSHGVMANADPLKMGELTLGDYLRAARMTAVVVGKSEGSPNLVALERFQIDQSSTEGQQLANNGFLPFELFSGIYPDPILPKGLGYNAYLRSHGFDGDNPWEEWANSAIDSKGKRVSGWQMRNAGLPARLPEEHSETAFTTRRAIEFLDSVDPDESWCMHLSYIKPHWPYLAPAPYHTRYHKDHVVPAVRDERERHNPHPVYQAFMAQDYSQNFSRDEVRDTVIPAYMGLIQQVDDHVGRVLAHLEKKGLRERTWIVFSSDHGDYLGDHWLGEKDLFHEPSVRIPLIIFDPSTRADGTRGRVVEEFVEAVDVVPTLVEVAGGTVPLERTEGRSLLPFVHQQVAAPSWRDCAISEIDFSDRGPRTLLRLHPHECRARMIRTAKWKYVLHEHFPPQLFDLVNDPHEFIDLGEDLGYRSARQENYDRLFTWFRGLKVRTEMPIEALFDMGPELDEELGIMIGHW